MSIGKIIKTGAKVIGGIIVADTLLTGAMVKIGIFRKGMYMIKNDEVNCKGSKAEAFMTGVNLGKDLSYEMTIQETVDACFGNFEPIVEEEDE